MEKAYESRYLNNSKMPLNLKKMKYLPSLTVRAKTNGSRDDERKNFGCYKKKKNENENNQQKEKSFEKDILNSPIKRKMNNIFNPKKFEGDFLMKSGVHRSFTKTTRNSNNSNFLIEENSMESSMNFKKVNPIEKNGKFFVVYFF